MNKNRKFYIALFFIFYAVWVVSFRLVGEYASTLEAVNPALQVDEVIPLVPQFVWIYYLCFIFPILPVFVLKDFHVLNITFLSVIVANIAAFALYIYYPVSFPQPALEPGSLSESLLRFTYDFDFKPGANKLPSLHVTFSWIVFLSIAAGNVSQIVKGSIFATALVISLSTLFVKQHLVLDVVFGVALAPVSWWLAAFLYANKKGKNYLTFLPIRTASQNSKSGPR